MYLFQLHKHKKGQFLRADSVCLQARSQHEADEAVASSVFSNFLFFVTENSQKFWSSDLLVLGHRASPRLISDPGYGPGL